MRSYPEPPAWRSFWPYQLKMVPYRLSKNIIYGEHCSLKVFAKLTSGGFMFSTLVILPYK